EVAGVIEAHAGRVSVAAVNSPRSVVVSGEPGPLEELLAGWERAGVRARRVAVGCASHPAQAGVLEAGLREGLGRRGPRVGGVRGGGGGGGWPGVWGGCGGRGVLVPGCVFQRERY